MSDTTSRHESTPASAPAEGDIAPAIPAADKPRAKQPVTDSSQLDPTRYGDWEKNGRCIDF